MPTTQDTFTEITLKQLPAELEQSSLYYLVDHTSRSNSPFYIVLGRRKSYGKKPPLELLTMQPTLHLGRKAEVNWSSQCDHIMTFKLVKELSSDAPKPIPTTPGQFTRLVQEVITSRGPDYEGAHARTDNLMEEVLIELGYLEGVELIRKTTRHYA